MEDFVYYGLSLLIIIIVLTTLITKNKENFDCDTAHCTSNIHTLTNPSLPVHMF